MKKKSLFSICIIILVIATFLCCGFRGKSDEKRLGVIVDGERMEYPVHMDGKTVRKANLFYRGSYVRMWQKSDTDNIIDYIGSLNEEIPKIIERIALRSNRAAKEPTVSLIGGELAFTEEVIGRTVNREKLALDLLFSLNTGEDIEVEFIPILPKITAENLKKNCQFLAEYRTYYGASGEGRKNNIALSASRINGVAVEPRGEFSFNGIVGKRTSDNGYLGSKVILDGEYVDGVGGGVCQVSTTLFCAWLLSGRTAISSASHSLVPSYVPPSFDAMVSDYSDLVLYNDSRYPCIITAIADGNILSVKIYGEKYPYAVKLRSVTLSITEGTYEYVKGDLDWREGETERITKPAHDGVVSEGYLDYYIGDTLVHTRKIRTSYYKTAQGEVTVRAEKNLAKAPEGKRVYSSSAVAQ